LKNIGLEFNSVILPGMEADCLRMRKSKENRQNFVYYEKEIISKLNLEENNVKDTKEYIKYILQDLKEILGEELIEKLGDKMQTYVAPIVNRYVDNYKKTINMVDNSGKLVQEENRQL